MIGYLTTGAAAREIGIDKATLTRWVHRGIATPAETTAGGHYRWELDSLRAQAERHRLGVHSITAEDIARVTHAAQRELQIIQGDPKISPLWGQAPDYQIRESTAGVREILWNRELTAERHHELWVIRMMADGWVYGAVKNWERKTHPNLLPFTELPAEQQLKNHVFIAIVRAMTPVS